MGFKASPTLYHLTFQGTDYDGLEITIGTLSVAGLLKLEELALDKSKLAGSATFLRVIEMLCEKIHSWNLEDESGASIRPSVDALLALETKLVTSVVESWTEAMVGVSAPLESDSTSGGTSLEASIQMEAL